MPVWASRPSRAAGSAAFQRQSALNTGYGVPKTASLETVGPKSKPQGRPSLGPHSTVPTLVRVATTAPRMIISSVDRSLAPDMVRTWPNSSGRSWA